MDNRQVPWVTWQSDSEESSSSEQWTNVGAELSRKCVDFLMGSFQLAT